APVNMDNVRLDRFARWAVARQLLMMSFGFISLWSVKFLAQRGGAPTGAGDAAAADYAMPYRVAQLLAYAALTLLSFSYGIAATAWAHGRRRRALVQVMRVGKFGGVGLLVLAAGLTILRDQIAMVLPGSYAQPMNELLPPLLGVFMWFSLIAFLVMLGDV